MSEPKLNIKEETSAKKTRSPPKKTKVEQSVPRRKKLKTDAEKTAEKSQHLRFGKAELTPDELSRLSKAQKREMYAAHAARSAVHREVDQYEDENVGVQALSEGEKAAGNVRDISKSRYARQFAAHRLALVGDAAHTIHPLAGQGVNLGFMDAAELIDELKRLHAQGKDIGQHLYLRRYERSRKHSAALMLAGMQGFREMFSGSHPAKKFLRDVGLKLADTLPGVKPQLIRQAMGLNDLPAWLR